MRLREPVRDLDLGQGLFGPCQESLVLAPFAAAVRLAHRLISAVRSTRVYSAAMRHSLRKMAR